MDIKILGTANLAQMRAQFAALEKQVAAFNHELEQSSLIPGRVNPSGYANMQRQAKVSSQIWRDAMASSGQFYSQQLRLNTATEKYTDLLKRQKLSYRDIRRNQAVLRDAYREQIAMQNMIVRENPISTMGGSKRAFDIAVPTDVSRELNTIGNRIGWVAAQTASASRQMINWGKNTQWAGRQLMVGFTMPIAAFGAAAGVLAYQTDAAFAKIAKVYDYTDAAIGDATQRTIEKNKLQADSMKLAADAAAAYGSTMKNTLDVEQQLAATGLKGTDLAASTKEVLRIAAIGDIDPTQATNMLISLQTAFKESSSQLTHTLNFMNAASNASSLSLQDIAEATPRAATAISQLGGTAEEMTTMLVSMREAGVDAAEGANALKSASTRIINPVKKATDYYDKFGISLENLAQKSGGNLFDYLKLLGAEQQKINGKNEKQTKLMRAQGIAALFGTYQNNRLTASLVNLTDAYGGVENQTKRVLDLSGKSNEELKKMADQSLGDVMESSAGKLKKAWAQLTGQLSRMGQPFLQVATKFLNIITVMAEKFNSLPSPVKKFAALSAIFLAIIGPAIMLVGLFANLTGNIGNTVANILNLIAKFNILNKEEWAQQKMAEMASKGFNTQATAVETLTTQINTLVQSNQVAAESFIALSEAMKLANQVPPPAPIASVAPKPLGPLTYEQYLNANSLAPQMIGPQTYGMTTRPLPPRPSAATVMSAQSSMPQPVGPFAGYVGNAKALGPLTYEQTVSQQLGPRKVNGKLMSDQLRVDEAIAKVEQRILSTQEQAVAARTATLETKVKEASVTSALAAKESALARAREAGRASVSGMAVGGAAMALSMGVMMMNTNKVVDNLAKTLMIGTLIIPAVKTIGLAAAGMAAKFALSARAAYSTAVASAAAVAPTNKLAGAFLLARTSGAGLLAGLSAMMGPIGWITLGLTAVAGVVYTIHKHHEDVLEAMKKEDDAARSLDNNAKSWAESVGKTADEYTKISNIAIDTPDPKKFYDLIDTYKNGSQKDEGKAFTDLGLGSDAQQRAAVKTFVDLQAEAGLSAEAASKHIQAMYIVAGMNAAQADFQAKQLLATFGDIAHSDWTKILANNIDQLNYSLGAAQFETGAFKDKATAIAETFGQAFDAASPEVAKKLFGQITDEVDLAYSQAMDNMVNNDLSGGDVQAFLDKYKITDGAGLRKWAQEQGTNLYSALEKELGGQTATNIFSELNPAMGMENTLVTAIAETQNLGVNIKTLVDLQNQYTIAAKTLSYADQVKQAQTLVAALAMMPGADVNGTQEAMAKAAINQMNFVNGFKLGGTAAQALKNLVGQIRDDTGGAADKAKDLGDNLSSAFNLSNKEWNSVAKDAMSGVTEGMATQASDTFDKAMNAAIDTAQNRWDKRIDKLDQRQQNASDRFDKRWDRRKDNMEKYYDSRVDKVDGAIKAEEKAEAIRQKIFEAEQARLDRLNESANRNIDFNVALNSGNFDEAAKIRNDMEAQAQNWALSDAQAKGGTQSQRKIDRLNNQKDELAKQKDAAEKALQKREEMERKHLEKIQKMNADALKQQSEDNMAKLKQDWEDDKTSLDQRLELFKSYTARNQKDLERWMKVVGLSYDDFGIDVKNKGDAWSTYFRTSLAREVRNAATQIASDKMWEKMGKSTAKDMIGGALDMSMSQFKNWMKTGEFVTGGYKSRAEREAAKAAKNAGHPAGNGNVRGAGNGGMGPQLSYHVGGEVGVDKGGRKGVARSLAGNHSSEVTARLQKGEFVVNRNAYSQNRELINAVNAGHSVTGDTRRGIFGGAVGPGIAGVMAAAVGSMVRQGIASSIQNRINAKMSEMFSSGVGADTYTAGKAGVYGDIAFDAEQLTNARTIANVGKSMGMSARDIEIGIMTAITESSLRNIHGGDRDSQGLFQQRPSQGWGTVAQVTDPEYAAQKFFMALKGVSGRGNMSPWLAAQSVQRSAFSDGSNYAQYWNEAMAIFQNGLMASSTVGTGPYIAGPGGKHRPVNIGHAGAIHDEYTGYPAVDFSIPTGTSVYAVGDGRISRSYDITGYEPRRAAYGKEQDGYRSYGKVMYLKLNAGPEVLYAHLSNRGLSAGAVVRGGSVIGKSGDTGNSTGPHLHFGAHGASPLAFLEKGGFTRGQGLAYLHDSEMVATKPMTQNIVQGVENFANAPSVAELMNAIASANIMLDPTIVQQMFASSSHASNDPANAGGNVRTGTYNVRYDTNNAKTKDDLEKLMEKADVLSLTEYSGSKLGLTDWLNSKGWGVSGHGSDAVVAFNKAVYSLLDEGMKSLNTEHHTSWAGGKDRKAAYALLQNKETGQKFWQVAAHTIAHLWKGQGAKAVQDEQFKSLNELSSNLGKSGLPVFVGGDLNSQNVGRIGLKSNWAGNMTGLGTHGNRYIDHILASMGTLIGQQVLKGHSDHRALLTQYNIPKFERGGFTMSEGLAHLHNEETILSKPMSKDFQRGVDNFASGGGNEYNLTMYFGDVTDKDDIAKHVIKTIKRAEERKPGSRKK